MASGNRDIKLGLVTGVTGPYSEEVKSQILGLNLAVDEFNKEGGFKNKKVKVVISDDKMNNKIAKESTLRLIKEENVDLLAGTMSAGTLVPASEEAKKYNIPFMGICQSGEVVKAEHFGPHSFHEAITPQMNAQLTARWVLENLSDSWFLLVADYSWGNQITQSYLEFAKRYNIQIKGLIKFPLGLKDFSLVFPQILNSKAEVLITGCFGADQLNFIKQSEKVGLKKKMSVIHTLSEISMAQKANPSDIAGMYWVANFYWGISEENPAAKLFTNKFKKAFNKLPNGYAAYAYSGIKELLSAVRVAGEHPINPEKITATLEGRSYGHYKGKQWWRPCDHQSFQDLYILKFKGIEERKNSEDYAMVLGSTYWDMEIAKTCEEMGFSKKLWGHAKL